MTWRDGVHLTGTPIWCDARRRRDVCFASSADRLGRAGHGQLIGEAYTLALLGARGGGHLPVPLYRRFTLGTLRLELLPSGRAAGAAALHVEAAGRSVLYAGAIRTDVPAVLADAAVEPAGARACDALVVAAPFGEARFPPLADTIAQTIEWARAQLAAGRHPVLLVETALDALEVATCLGGAQLPVAGDRAVRALARLSLEAALAGLLGAGTRARRDAELRGDVAPSRRAGRGELSGAPPMIGAPGKEPRATLGLVRDRAALERALGDRPRAVALVSGRALDPSEVAAAGAERGFAWTHAAARAPLLAWIESTSARAIYVTGPAAGAIAAALGRRAQILAPPHQMTLFEREAR